MAFDGLTARTLGDLLERRVGKAGEGELGEGIQLSAKRFKWGEAPQQGACLIAQSAASMIRSARARGPKTNILWLGASSIAQRQGENMFHQTVSGLNTVELHRYSGRRQRARRPRVACIEDVKFSRRWIKPAETV